MFDQLFESFRKASESSLHAQQEMFKQWMQQWPSAPFTASGMPSDWSDVQKRWIESTTEALNRHRALMDATYKAGIDVIGQAFRVSEARTPEDYRRLVEELWRRLSDNLRAQSEAQLRDFHIATERWMERAQKTQNAQAAS